jgi:hypothetical protein
VAEGIELVLVVIALVVVQFGCGTSLSGVFRNHTYPADFHYVPEDKLRASMWLLGHETAELRRVLADPSLSNDTRRIRTELLLGGMEDTCKRSASESGRPTIKVSRAVSRRCEATFTPPTKP